MNSFSKTELHLIVIITRSYLNIMLSQLEFPVANDITIHKNRAQLCGTD